MLDKLKQSKLKGELQRIIDTNPGGKQGAEFYCEEASKVFSFFFGRRDQEILVLDKAPEKPYIDQIYFDRYLKSFGYWDGNQWTYIGESNSVSGITSIESLSDKIIIENNDGEVTIDFVDDDESESTIVVGGEQWSNLEEPPESPDGIIVDFTTNGVTFAPGSLMVWYRGVLQRPGYDITVSISNNGYRFITSFPPDAADDGGWILHKYKLA